MSSLTEAVVTIALAIVGVAMLALLVSKRSDTAGIIQAGASGLGNTLGVAISPVTGGSYSINLGYPGGAYSGLGFG